MIFPPSQVGVNVAEAFELASADRRAVFAAIAKTGATWVRCEFPWMLMEGNRGSYTFATTDAVVADAHAAGLKILAVVAHPKSYGWLWFAQAAQPSDFAAFCRALAAQYHPSVDAWELYNEQNLSINFTGSNPAAWTPYLIAGYRALKANGVTVPVLLGGLAACASASGWAFLPWPTAYTNTDPVAFLTGVYAAGGGGCFDGVSYHPYAIDRSFKGVPVSPTDEYLSDCTALRAVMDAHHDTALSLWATEFGRDTSVVTETAQSVDLVLELNVLAAQPVSMVFPYCWRDNNGQKFGLVRADNSAKQALAQFVSSIN